MAITITTIYYMIIKTHLIESYLNRYDSLGGAISNSFIEMDKLSDSINYNAAKYFALIQQHHGLPDNDKLESIAQSLGVHGLYAINNSGKFIRSSDLPLNLQKNSLFSYCANYRGLITGETKFQITPIVPSYPDNVPAKFVMIPNYDSSLILETGYHLKYMEEILLKTFKENKNIVSIGLYSPNDYELGYIDKFEQGKNITHAHAAVNADEKIFKYKVLANTKDCCECTVKNTEYLDGPYYYSLVIKVSTAPLINELNQFKIRVLLILGITIFFAFIISQIISRMITRRLAGINTSINKIIKTGDLSNEVAVINKSSKNELDSLAMAFNHMIQQLKLYQESSKNRAIAEVASKILHNIRSPLVVLDTIAEKIKHGATDANISLLKNAIKDIKTLSEKLLLTYRSSMENDSFNNENNEIDAYTTISLMVKEVVASKNIEWANNLIDMSVTISEDCIFSWIKTVPSEFRSMISNLINNSYEALNKPESFIKVNLSFNSGYYKIMVEDNGVGIQQDKLATIRDGESSKHEGKGIGLSTAIRYVEGVLNGTLEITSWYNKKTIVTILIPYTKPPFWFTNKIKVTKSSQIFVLDDDSSIINYWEQRFKEFSLSGFYSTTISGFIENYEQHKHLEDKVFLIDYELSNDINGLSLIKTRLCGEKNIHLVTTHAEEHWIQKDIESLIIYMIPKSHISDIHIIQS